VKTIEELQSEIAALQAQSASLKAKESAEKLAQVKEIVQAYGLTADQIFGGKSASRKLFDAPKSANPVPIKYRGPNGETWTGRGRSPAFIVEAKANGTLDRMAV